MSTQTTESWSGRLAFILASIGAAVGLGNIWQFPANLGTSGGSAFVLGERKLHLLVPIAVVAAVAVWYLVQETLGIFLRPWPGFLQ